MQLHCTVLNTIYRKPRGKRTPFSYAGVLASPAFQSIEVVTDANKGGQEVGRARGRSPISVDLGEWTVDEVQVCEMGSWGPEGEYVVAGRCRLS